MSENNRVAAVGMFDGVHIGHRFLINFIKNNNNSCQPPIIITFSNHPLSLIYPEKSPELLSTPKEKKKLINDYGASVELLAFDDELRKMSSYEFMKMLKEKYNVGKLIIGFNNRFGYDLDKSVDDYISFGKELGINVIKAPEYNGYCKNISSSTIRKLLKEGNIEEANKMLGSVFTISGKVIGGHQLGRTIGFPTANIEISDKNKILPKEGVYAAIVKTKSGDTCKAVVNIGTNPTVDNKDNIKIETHLINFEGNLYNKNLSVSLLHYIRPEHKFSSLQALKQQIKKDIEIAVNQ